MKPPRRPVAPDRHLASEQLSKDWKFVLDNENTISSEAIKKLVGSDQAAIRFCLPTQILGKLVDPSLDALCLQRGDGSSGRWDPRGFATKESDDDISEKIVAKRGHTEGTASTQISSTKELFRALGLTDNVKGVRDAPIVLREDAITALVQHFEQLA